MNRNIYYHVERYPGTYSCVWNLNKDNVYIKMIYDYPFNIYKEVFYNKILKWLKYPGILTMQDKCGKWFSVYISKNTSEIKIKYMDIKLKNPYNGTEILHAFL